MSLREFLKDKTGTAEELLLLAKDEVVKSGSLIHRDTMNGWLGEKEIYIRFKEIAETPAHPFRNAMTAFLDSVEFNFIQGSETGDAHIALLDALIAFEITVSAELTELKPRIIARANPESKAYPNVTLHDVLVATDAITRMSKQAVNGWLKISVNTSLNSNFEAHRPQIYVDVQGVLQRVAGFNVVSETGDYVAQVPRGYSEYFVDDAYGVVG